MAQSTEYFYDEYTNAYWIDASESGYNKIKYIDNNKLSNDIIHDIMNSITYNECLGVYNYIYKNKNNLFEIVLKLNPFGKDLILNAHLIFFWINNELIKDNIDEYPEQKHKLDEIINDINNNNYIDDYIDDYHDY
jgi:hypothetical protein